MTSTAKDGQVNLLIQETIACRICLASEPKTMIKPCQCSGTMANVHFECVKRWILMSGHKRCGVCLQRYSTGLRIGYKKPSFRTYWRSERPPNLGVWFASGILLVFILTVSYLIHNCVTIGQDGLISSRTGTFVNGILLACFHLLISSLLVAIAYYGFKNDYRDWSRENMVMEVLPVD